MTAGSSRIITNDTGSAGNAPHAPSAPWSHHGQTVATAAQFDLVMRMR